MTTCNHLRQVPEPSIGGDCLMDIQLSDVLPCAEPECPAGIHGDGMVTEQRTGFDSWRRQEYQREATPDGWAWRKKVPA